MPSLLDIPPELRNKILSLVIAAPSLAPQNPSVAADRTELHDVENKGWFDVKNVKYAHLNRTDAIPTLLVNRQLHAETVAAIELLPTKHFYILDVMVVDENELWPTWLCVPSLTTRVDKVYAAFRIVGTSKKRRSGFAGGDGGPPLISWCFYSLLGRFLRVGPVGNQEKQLDKGVSIKTLELDVRTPDVPEELLGPKDMRTERKLGQLRKESGIDYIMHPEYLLYFIASMIRILLRMSYHTAAFGGILYERIGMIRLMLDGELWTEYDLAKVLAKVQFDDSFGEYPRERRQAVFKQWKSNAYQTRIHFDLPIVPLEGDEINGPALSQD